MAAKNIIIRKQIEGVLYDLMPKTLTSQVYDDNNTQLATLLSDIATQIAAKAANTDLQALKTKFDNLVKDAPEAYDTLLEISTWIGTHKDEYDALVGLIATKVTAEEGKGLSTNDFTDAYKEKLEALYTKDALDTKFSNLESADEALAGRATAVEGAIATLNGADTVEGSVAKKIKDAVTPVSTKADANEAAIATLNGADTVEGSVAKKIKDAVTPVSNKANANEAAIEAINNETTGILAQAKADATTKANQALADAKEYADQKVAGTAKIYATANQPEGITENDLWLAIVS